MKFVIEMSKEAYKKLVDYALKTCDSFSLCLYDVYGGARDFEIENFNIITSNPKYSTDQILKNYWMRYIVLILMIIGCSTMKIF